MNAKLLQKIEELTLHLIAQQKKAELQEKSIYELRNRLIAIETVQKLERNPVKGKRYKSNK